MLVDNPLALSCLAAALVGLVCWSLSTEDIRRDGRKLRKPPNTLPLIGNGLLFLQARHKLFSWFVTCEGIFGYETFRISVPSLPPGVVINDPTNLDFVFKNEGIFTKGDFVKRRSWDLFGNGIINADGELWKVQRKAGLNFLSTSNLRVLTDVALPRYLAQSIDFLRSRCDGTVVDLQALFHEITTQLMGKMAYNMEMHADDEFTVSFEHGSAATAERFQNPLWPMTEILFGSKLRRSIATVKAYGQKIVASAVRDRNDGCAKPAPESKLDDISGSLVQSLLDSIGDEHMVADAALNYLSAGRDTTAQALTWTFYLLLQHRYAAAQIRREALQALLDNDDVDDGSGGSGNRHDATSVFTPAVMPYTLATLYEALRLFPPIPFEIKQCVAAGTVLPDKTVLPAGAVVLWCPWAMGRSRTTWGDDADAFRPERWLAGDDESGRKRVVARGAAEFPVFNGGPRTCLGKKMAEAMAVQVVAALVREFEFVGAFEGGRVSRSSLTLPMEGGLPCLVRRRAAGAL